jgi:ornithine carbamoyltransferase
VMDGDKSEHILEAIPVMGSYCDIIGVRSFAQFESKEDDYNEVILNQFIQYSGKPVISMEAATRHPLQSFADLITIEEYKKTPRPKVVLTWAPHPKPLPQAVANSFCEWMNATDYEFVITHPEGYELDEKFVGKAHVEYDKEKAYKNADFIYAKNWSAYRDPNYGKVINMDRSWTVDARKMEVAKQPGLAMLFALRIFSLLSSHKPKTNSRLPNTGSLRKSFPRSMILHDSAMEFSCRKVREIPCPRQRKITSGCPILSVKQRSVSPNRSR